MGKDKRIVWKDQSDLKIILTISQFIETYEIKSSLEYQKQLSKNPHSAPSMWFIINKYGSWNNLLNSIGIDNNGSKKWARMETDELIKVAQIFIDSENLNCQIKLDRSSILT